MFHFAGFSEGFTLSVDKDIFTKSVIKIIISIVEAEITYLPSIRKAITTKHVFKMVLAILLSIHVLIRSNIILPTLIGAIMFASPSSVNTMLAAPLTTSVALLTAIPTSACFSAGASFTPSPVTVLKGSSDVGRPHLRWKKGVAQAVDLYADHNDGNGFVLIGRFLRPQYLDVYPLAAGKISDTYKYKVIYVIADEQVGLMSPIITITASRQ